jgi:nitrogen-specific signal transduction histidine kinase/CheY-like chemotaxis protein
MSEEVFEILIYDLSSIKIAEKSKAESKYKQKILAKIAHEFKTPLITIITLIQNLNDLESLVNLEASAKKKLSHVVNLSNYTIYLIQDIINYVSEASSLRISLSKVNLKENLDFCYDVLQTLVECNEKKSKNIETFFDYDKRIKHLKILTDENKLKQILLNLISNSVKFTFCGNIKLNVKISNDSSNLIISVEDSGIGIKEEDFHLIFQDNIQINLDKDYNSKGSGLGLGISKLLAVSMNYEINFESTLGKGTKFYLKIPLTNSPKSILEKESESGSKTERIKNYDFVPFGFYREMVLENSLKDIFDRSSNNISFKQIDNNMTKRKTIKEFRNKDIQNLISEEIKELSICNYNFTLSNSYNLSIENCIVVVDDYKLVRINTINLIKSTLSILNINQYNIIEGSDGVDLLNIVRNDEKGKIKCIFIDENMEYLNGSETVKIIRKLEQKNKVKSQYIVSITAFDDIGTRNNILDSGVNTILSKPCTKTSISQILKNILC